MEATPSNPGGGLTEVQSPMVAGAGAPPGEEVPPDGSCATLFDAPPTWFAANFSFVTGCAAALDPEPGWLPVATVLSPVEGAGDEFPPVEPDAVSPGF